MLVDCDVDDELADELGRQCGCCCCLHSPIHRSMLVSVREDATTTTTQAHGGVAGARVWRAPCHRLRVCVCALTPSEPTLSPAPGTAAAGPRASVLRVDLRRCKFARSTLAPSFLRCSPPATSVDRLPDAGDPRDLAHTLALLSAGTLHRLSLPSARSQWRPHLPPAPSTSASSRTPRRTSRHPTMQHTQTANSPGRPTRRSAS